MNRTTLRHATGPIGFMLIVLACWFVAGMVADRMVQQELAAALHAQRQMAASIVDNMAEVIASDLAMSRAIPATLAEMDMIQHALVQSRNYAANGGATEPALRAALLKDPRLSPVSTFLHRAQGFSGLDQVWLVNANGICVASSDVRSDPRAPRGSFLGIDMRVRAYLAKALLGAFSETYGVGRTTGEPGIFIAVPVYADGELAGAVVAKVGIARLRHWVAHAGTFVADDNGVIIMAHDSKLEGHALPNSRIAKMSVAERTVTYRRDGFPDIQIRVDTQVREQAPWVSAATAGQLFGSSGQPGPALYQTRSGLNSGLSAHLVEPLSAWPELLRNHKRDHLLVFLTLAGTVALAWVITVSYVRERRHHRATRDLAEQLQSANTLLSAEARHDALTGALSRRYFLDLLRHEIDRAHLGNQPLCMAIADLDHFKQINDRFGHAAGDRALEHFVDTCRAELRGADAIGRLGGEEFGLLLPATDLAGGREVVERLRLRLKAVPSSKLPASVTLSVSIGITELSVDDLPERIMSRADMALYAAKTGGRDRTEALPPDDTAPPARTVANVW
ncbi:sensor domain-containing diguanylate cyclase [bacterium M00.F.Ca.ET.228.01.1.1]|uniref:sensor domain-containing diguanylate cyclase n=1 Tax=Paraburkholderia phenoliruptrix TaxID=252970 RepID=UPI001091CEA8|nr:sensor domain-containing diguanylate cyclase [Paraburkholderia phenoliruptrix]TGP43284.1 sensor domain-containing diguanylate cyclase [bacterium M00.F.Ca.ET.228.01.1.1]TGS00722.1 sensor domain-containing diguanylate cyclase [bacterium M00.F.Ca.ET.191.01.1.1]TGU05109.1 sensor domain-containing diguanylate cyclase [bacterium M00.F.Ca.ET.155.01.1.1]MBW0446778.1 diguanylate cyclase [Paraburkholderia phenoliruptrix]MBW9099274.1 diguanylate cyclase [Paraburkholderia phenoliruptrix]